MLFILSESFDVLLCLELSSPDLLFSYFEEQEELRFKIGSFFYDETKHFITDLSKLRHKLS